jgi:hypothetical protein
MQLNSEIFFILLHSRFGNLMRKIECLLKVVECLLSGAKCCCGVSLSLVVVNSYLSDVGCRLLIAWCRCHYLLLVPSPCQMSIVGCRLLIAWCRCRWLFLVRLSGVGC